jgi:putative OPT family oligopeptide transporter
MPDNDTAVNSDNLYSEPIIPANVSLPEITLRAIVLGIVLTVILAAANAYLGLKVGQTVSASIPAAIISMNILRWFKNSNVLENTMVQTMASVGEALIAGVSFILPALIILHAWKEFYYWQTVMIALLGGILGVLFTIPLRRALLFDKTLRYPEGIAIANVLRTTMKQEKSEMRSLTLGGMIGAFISLCQTGFQILTDTFDFWVKTSTATFGFSLGLSPALIAAGYIIGVNVAISFLVGIFIGWLAGIPILTSLLTLPDGNANEIVMGVYRSSIRYIGVGTMLVGALWTLCTLAKPIIQSIAASFTSLRATKEANNIASIRTENDIAINYVFWGILLLIVPIFILIAYYIVPETADISHTFRIMLSAFSALYVIVGGFLFCSISAYFAGLIGSSNTPVSGLLVSALLLLCLLILVFFKTAHGIAGNELIGMIFGIGTCVVMSVGIAISNDTMQDLKVGAVVGATPWKQQVMLIVGVMVSAFVVPPILDLLYQAYGIGGVFPRPNMNPAQMLSAPQAALMATVAEGVYTFHLPWHMIMVGAVIAILCIVIDEIAKQFGTRLPVLAVGLAIYLPMNTTIPVVIGGFLSHFIQRGLEKRYEGKNKEALFSSHKHRGLLIACGMVAGASLMGVVLAIPFAIRQSSDALRLMPEQYMSYAGILSVFVTFIMCAWMYHTLVNKN